MKQVKGASLAIERNKLLALLGPNGAGNTPNPKPYTLNLKCEAVPRRARIQGS